MRFVYFLISLLLSFYAQATTSSITLLAEDSFPPYSYVENKQAVGLSIDIIRAAFASQNIKVQFESVPFSRCLAKIQSGLELGCFNTTYDPTALDTLIFPKYPLAIVKAIALTHVDNKNVKISKISDLQDSEVVITLGYSYGPEFDYDKRIKKNTASSDVNVIKVVANKRSRYGVLNFLTYRYLRHYIPDSIANNVRDAGPIGTGGLYVMFSKRNPQGEKYAHLYDQGMQNIINSGKYDQILKTWGQKLGLNKDDLLHLSAKNPDPLREPSSNKKK